MDDERVTKRGEDKQRRYNHRRARAGGRLLGRTKPAGREKREEVQRDRHRSGAAQEQAKEGGKEERQATR
jgi:hypothetical protein